mmetsp:Transcript_26018/g.51029  ORF Transcript_26018/g.51029 Transcript_26018/m.51029 type:complete len:117 (+) Transcript_26018:250-600(+)
MFSSIRHGISLLSTPFSSSLRACTDPLSMSAVPLSPSILNQRCDFHKKSKSVIFQAVQRLPIRKRFKRAIRMGLMVYEKGQVKLPPIAVAGYDVNGPNKYRGKLENCRATRISFHD